MQQSLINLSEKRDKYSIWFNTVITNWNTTVERFEWGWTKLKTKIDDYFIVSIKNSKWKIQQHYIAAGYDKLTYPDINKWEFSETLSNIINISPSNKYLYITTNWWEWWQWYLIRLSDGKMMYQFDWGGWSRAIRTPDRQRFIVGWNLWMGIDDNLWISKKSDITQYSIIKLNWYTRSLIANNKTVWIYVNRIKHVEEWEMHIWYAEEYDLETWKLISSKQISSSNSWES